MSCASEHNEAHYYRKISTVPLRTSCRTPQLGITSLKPYLVTISDINRGATCGTQTATSD